jgi:hypothetical protein
MNHSYKPLKRCSGPKIMRPERIAVQHALLAHRIGDGSVRQAGDCKAAEFDSIVVVVHASGAASCK